MPKQTQDSFSAFMATAARYPLLTHLEEVELAQQVRAWLDAEDPSPATIAAGQRARERLICCNLRLIVHVAKRHQKRGLEIPDMVQEGTLGLNRAIEMFDPAKGYRFSTYAYPWINQAITRAIQNTSRFVRLPTHIWDLLFAAQKVAEEHCRKHGRYPTTQEVGETLIASRNLKPRSSHAKGEDPKAIAIAKLEHSLAMHRTMMSLNYVIGDSVGDEPLEIGNIVECPRPRPEAVAAESDQKLFTEKLLRYLPARHRAVLVARYGLDGNPPQPYAKIGEALGMGTRSAKTMHDRAIRNLRAKVGDSDFVELVRGA